jgi:uncharacterized protein YukJ
MALTYGCVKCKVSSKARLRGTRHRDETEFHLLVELDVASDGGDETWQAAINVGSDKSTDLLKYRFVFDFHHPIRDTLAGLPAGFSDFTGRGQLPALDFLRSDILADTGNWRETDPMDGSDQAEPIPTMTRLLETARQQGLDTYLFGHTFDDNGRGIHDIHMNQGSTGSLLNDDRDADKDHNMIWQDGAVIVDLGDQKWAGYFTAFAAQLVPTDDDGNPTDDAHPIEDSDPGSLAGQ